MTFLSNDDATPKVDEEDSTLKKQDNHIKLFRPSLQLDNLNVAGGPGEGCAS